MPVPRGWGGQGQGSGDAATGYELGSVLCPQPWGAGLFVSKPSPWVCGAAGEQGALGSVRAAVLETDLGYPGQARAGPLQ